MRRFQNVLVLVLGLGSTIAMLTTLPAGATTTKTPTTSSVISAAKAAIAKEKGVHLVVHSVSSVTSGVVADLGTTTGVESVTSGSETASIRITAKAAYLDGNSAGLTGLIGLTAAQAKKVGKLWISVKAGTSQYTDLKSGTTVSAITGVLPNAAGTSLSTDRSGSSPHYVLKWTVAATTSAPKLTNTFSLAATGATLPIEETTTDASATGSTTFTKWGENVNVTAPPVAQTIDYTKVTG